MKPREISFAELSGFGIGHAQDEQAKTGVTVLYFPDGARVGCDISGGGPASRETPLTHPTTADNRIHAIVLSGGSAYGLAASDGVMQCLEEHAVGYDTGLFKVPLVVQSCIYDLAYGDGSVRPDVSMGRSACERAMKNADVLVSGDVGAGIGATVGKICGMHRGCKAGLGTYAIQIGDVTLAAVAVVNAVGDVFDSRTGKKLAGVMNEKRSDFLDTTELMTGFPAPKEESFVSNTTISAIITNAAFDKAQVNKLASMARSAYARAIRPVGTMADGDSIYFASTGQVPADLNAIGALGAEVLEEAIRRAITGSKVSEEEYLASVRA